jgi:hypothetical protein
MAVLGYMVLKEGRRIGHAGTEAGLWTFEAEFERTMRADDTYFDRELYDEVGFRCIYMSLMQFWAFYLITSAVPYALGIAKLLNSSTSSLISVC